jgi:hypothetical protein
MHFLPGDPASFAKVKDFDVEAAADIIASKFEAKTYEKNFLMRGRHFPKDIMRNRQIIELERERESGKMKERSE